MKSKALYFTLISEETILWSKKQNPAESIFPTVKIGPPLPSDQLSHLLFKIYKNGNYHSFCPNLDIVAEKGRQPFFFARPETPIQRLKLFFFSVKSINLRFGSAVATPWTVLEFVPAASSLVAILVEFGDLTL